MNLTQHENGEEGLQLVRPRAIRGIFSYLLGETRKLFQSNEPSEIPLFNDEEREELFAKARIKLTERPWFSWFFARRDFHKKASSYIVNSKISLGSFSLDQADASLKLLEIPLVNCFNTRSLGDLNEIFNDQVVNESDKSFEVEKTRPPKINNIPRESKMGEAMIAYAENAWGTRKMNFAIRKLINETNRLCEINPEYKSILVNSRSGKFSVFTAPGQTKQWVHKDYYPIVRGAPMPIACVNFEIFIDSPSVKAIERLKNGPGIARWGEGGVAFLEYRLDEMASGVDESDSTFISLKELRKLGVKVWKTKLEKELSEIKITD